jgi:hypothetical protein
MDFEGDIAVAAANTQKPDAPRHAGDWCRFCLAAPICPTNRDSAMADALAEFSVDGEMTLPSIDDLTPEQRAHILRSAEKISNFVAAVQQAEHDNALRGDTLPGFKLVAKRATRRWGADETVTLPHLIRAAHVVGKDKADLFAEPKMLSPTQVEKVIGKKPFEKLLAEIKDTDEIDLVVKRSSGVNLVEASDPRPAVANEALAEFSAVDVEN